MKSLLASVRAVGGLDRVDHAVQLLEDEWRKHGDVPLGRLWTDQKRLLESQSDEPIILLAELIRTDLRCRFARGQAPAVADYLGRFPELNAADTRVLSLIYEEFCLAEERGGPVNVEEFCNRYPRWKESLASQLQYHHLFSQAAGVRPNVPPFPEAGDTFEEFKLVSLLGRGGTSRVFLARDLSLGGKQVVLKVSLDRGREPQAQGVLDHPHIVPVNSVVFGDRDMRGLSMPYRPGLPLDEVIRRVDPASKPRGAMALWEALVRVPAGTSEDSPNAQVPPIGEVRIRPRGDGWEGFPVRGTYAQGVAWIVRVIAGALHYAHGEKTYHRDVKPANVLLTLQHGPQLLDFNLAESPHSASQAQAAMHGGTLPYMAPEQIEAFLNPELWGKVGAQADVYSLGLVLRELLTGQAPDIPAETLSPPRAMRVLLDRRPMLDVSVRRTNPAIPHALEAIVAKCLKVTPDQRYSDAGALADDLERFLLHAPLVHAVNPSVQERCANWGVRNRLGIATVTACLVALLLGVAAGRLNMPIRPTTPIELSPAFRDALGLLDEGEVEAASGPLTTLVAQYPESSLPKMFLCFAHDASGLHEAADDRFREVLRTPNYAKQLRAWSERYTRLAERLEKFSDVRGAQGADFRGRRNLGERDREQGSIKQFTLAKDARRLALELKGVAEQNDFKMAVYEEGMHEYEAVYERASRAIESIRSERASNYASMREIEPSRFNWSWLRSRVATELADRLRAEGPVPDLEKARQYMVDAEKDLQSCDHFVIAFTPNPRETCWVEGIRAPAMLTWGEIELDLQHLREADSHLKNAKHAMSKYKALSQQLTRNDTSNLELLDEKLSLWETRLKAGNSRLHRLQDENKARDASTSPAEKTAANGPAIGR
jgi:serine/threonine protein kinase